MELQTARRIGRNQTLKTLGLWVLGLELLVFLKETEGDLANGLLFYIDLHWNIYLGLFYIFVFGATWLLGCMTGEEIILKGRNYIWIGLRNVVLMITLIAVIFFVFYLKQQDGEPERRKLWLGLFFRITLIMFAVWGWIVWKIKRKTLNRSV